MAYNTGNALGSSDVRDLKDNAVNLDWFANGPAASYPDRFGTARKSIAQMNAEFMAEQISRENTFIATQNVKQAAFDAAQVDRSYQFNELLKNSAYEVPIVVGRGLCLRVPEAVPVQLLEQERPELHLPEWCEADSIPRVGSGTDCR
jgi:hypothetical protein